MRVERIGNATLYLGDCLDILPTLPKVDAVITDPPYGLGDLWRGGNAASKGRWKLSDGGRETEWDGATTDAAVSLAIDKAPISIVWGGQVYRLPIGRCWLAWNKIIRNWSSSEMELAWTNLERANKAFDYSHGQLANEGKHYHPTQKPVPLMAWCIEQASRPRVTLDPFMGSGTTGVAAVQLGVQFVGIEREQRYFDIACKRLEEANRQQPLIPHEQPKQEQMEIEPPELDYGMERHYEGGY